MTIPELQEARNEAYDKMEAVYENSEGDFSESEEKEYESAKAKVDKLDKQMARAKEVEDMKAKKAFAKHDKEKASDAENQFIFREALNYLKNPQSVNSDKRKFYNQVNEEGTETARSNGVTLQGNGFVIPANVFQNAVDVTTEGDDVLFDQEGEFIQVLRDRMVLSQLGTRYLSGLSGDVRMPKQTKAATFTWETETGQGTPVDTEYGNVTLSPSRGFSAVDFSNQMLAQSSLGMEQMIRDDIFNSVAHGVEQTAINGGGTNAPGGILDVATEVTDGASLYEQVVNLEAEVTGKNITGSFGYLTDTGTRAAAKTSVKEAGEARYVWEQGNTINGYQTAITNAVTADQLIFGDFSNLIIGDFSGIEILVDPYTQALSGITRFVVNVYMGTAIRRDEAFAYADLTPST